MGKRGRWVLIVLTPYAFLHVVAYGLGHKIERTTEMAPWLRVIRRERIAFIPRELGIGAEQGTVVALRAGGEWTEVGTWDDVWATPFPSGRAFLISIEKAGTRVYLARKGDDDLKPLPEVIGCPETWQPSPVNGRLTCMRAGAMIVVDETGHVEWSAVGGGMGDYPELSASPGPR